MNIIIFGASGRTGSALLRQALLQGHQVTAFVRKQANVKHPKHQNLVVFEGDLNSLEHVRAAMYGKEAVVSALGVSRTLRHDPDVIQGIATIVNAMAKEEIDRFIYLSVFLANNQCKQFSFFAEKVLKKIIRREIEDHESKERIIRDGVKDYTIVRATRLTDDPLTRKYRHGERIVIKNFLPSIPRADVAHFMVKQLVETTYRNRAVLLTSSP
jgi:hypothetical protein